MSIEFQLPDLHKRYLQKLFPTLDFSRVRYFSGIPEQIRPPLPFADQQAITQQIGTNQQAIYFRDYLYGGFGTGAFNAGGPLLCTTEGFLTLVHEHTHVLQIQQSFGAGRILGSWNFNYVTCLFASGFSALNCYERDAYDYANGPLRIGDAIGRVRAALDQWLYTNPVAPGTQVPFSCAAPYSPFGLPAESLIAPNKPNAFANWQALIASNGLEKRTSGCSLSDCLGNTIPVLGWIWDIVALIAGLLIGFATLPGVNLGSYVGMILGGLAAGIGVLLGGIIGVGTAIGGGFLAGLASLFLAFFAGILAAVLGAALGSFLGSLLSDLFDFLFGGDSGGQLNIETSVDDGVTFDYKTKSTFERSREQMAIALDDDSLAIGWTGLDAQVNVVTIKTQPKPPAGSSPPAVKKSFEQSNHCGPALAWGDAAPGAQRPLYVVWQGTDGRLNTMVSLDNGHSFASKNIIRDPRLPSDLTPGLAVLNGFLYVAWQGAGASDVIAIWGSPDEGVTYPNAARFYTSERTSSNGTTALATDGNNLFLAWSGADVAPFIYVMTLQQNADGSLTQLAKANVTIEGAMRRVHPGTGVALTFDASAGRLLLAWIDERQAMRVASSSDALSFGNEWVLANETSRGNCGPGLGWGQSTVVLGWTGQG